MQYMITDYKVLWMKPCSCESPVQLMRVPVSQRLDRWAGRSASTGSFVVNRLFRRLCVYGHVQSAKQYYFTCKHKPTPCWLLSVSGENPCRRWALLVWCANMRCHYSPFSQFSKGNLIYSTLRGLEEKVTLLLSAIEYWNDSRGQNIIYFHLFAVEIHFLGYLKVTV